MKLFLLLFVASVASVSEAHAYCQTQTVCDAFHMCHQQNVCDSGGTSFAQPMPMNIQRQQNMMPVMRPLNPFGQPVNTRRCKYVFINGANRLICQ
jgi:hypothetical protein